MPLHRLPSVLLIFFLLLLPLGWAVAQSGDADTYDIPLEKIEKQAVKKYFGDSDAKIFRYEKSTTINSGEEIQGNVLVVSGDLKVRGKIYGNVLVLLGDVKIMPGAEVHGNITCVNGRIMQRDSSMVSGNQTETKVKNLFPYRAWEKKYFVTADPQNYRFGYRRPYSTLPLNPGHKALILNYNRVEGLFLGMAFPKKITGKYNYFNLHGFAGYGFQLKKWRYELAVDRWLFSQKDFRFEIGGRIYDLTDTHDDWLITPLENSLAAFFLHDDYQNYFRRRGYELHASQNLTIYFKGLLAYRSDKYNSLQKNTDWALFGGKKKFAENPGIDEGDMRSLYGELYLDTRDNIELPRRGWFARLGMETSNSKLRSDYSFNQYEFEIRRYQPITRFDRLDIRLKAATSEGSVPLQKQYQLGGISTLRGFAYKALHGGEGYYGGDRMLLANIDYNLNPKIIGTNFLFFDNLRYILFFDVGNVWMREQVSSKDGWSEGFDWLKLNDLKSDLGVAFTSWSGRFRLSIAKRLDTGKEPFRVTVRLTKPF